MTESLLQQARRWRESASKPTREMNGFDWINFKCFLDDVIEFMEDAKLDHAQFETVTSRPTQRTHTLAIMAATIYSSDRSSGNPEYETVEERIVWAAERAQNLLAEVENRNP